MVPPLMAATVLVSSVSWLGYVGGIRFENAACIQDSLDAARLDPCCQNWIPARVPSLVKNNMMCDERCLLCIGIDVDDKIPFGRH